MEENNKQHIVWHDDVIVKQFISYAVGCMMGRYSIESPVSFLPTKAMD